MTPDDITNQQLLDALTVIDGRFNALEGRFDGLETRFDGLEQRFDGLESRFDSLEEMLAGVKDVVTGIANTMVTSEELTGFKEELYEDFDNLELRLGRRIDAALSTGKTTR